MALSHYAELWCLSNFSFLRGASRPEELVERAHELGYSALALTDECSMAGIVRAHVAAKEVGLKLLIGAQFNVEHAAPFTFIVVARNLHGYGNLCEFITGLRRSADKGTYRLTFGHLAKQRFEDCLVLMAPPRGTSSEHLNALTDWLQASFEDPLRTASSATAWALPKWIRRACPCSSSASSAGSATNRRTVTSTSSTSAVKRSCSTCTRSTGANAPRSWRR